MPIYEYACAACGHETEIWQKIAEKAKKTCPQCGAKKLERLISHTSFQLKGTGWYVTDYARKDSGSGSKTSTTTTTSKPDSSKSSANKAD